MIEMRTFETPWGIFGILQRGARFDAIFEGDGLGELM
jgi:hypothetical protein